MKCLIHLNGILFQLKEENISSVNAERIFSASQILKRTARLRKHLIMIDEGEGEKFSI